MNFPEKVAAMMQRSGKTYQQCCKALGARGGQVAARKKRAARAERERLERMRLT